MEGKAKIIYTAEKSNLPTNQPALYFGASDGNVYVIYQKAYDTDTKNSSRSEIVVMRSEEFAFGYGSEKVIYKKRDLSERILGFFKEFLDKPDHKLTPMKSFKSSGKQSSFRLIAEGYMNKFIEEEVVKNLKST